MNRDDVIRLAREAGFPEWWLMPPEPERTGLTTPMLERFAQLVAARVAGEIASELEAAVNVVSHEPTKKLVVGLANAIRNRRNA